MTATTPARPSGIPSLAPARGSVRLAGQHFAAATMYLTAGAAGLVWIAPDLAAGAYLSPRVAGVTHLFTLGWLTTAIFGALTQRSKRVGYDAGYSFASRFESGAGATPRG